MPDLEMDRWFHFQLCSYLESEGFARKRSSFPGSLQNKIIKINRDSCLLQTPPLTMQWRRRTASPPPLIPTTNSPNPSPPFPYNLVRRIIVRLTPIQNPILPNQPFPIPQTPPTNQFLPLPALPPFTPTTNTTPNTHSTTPSVT